MRKYTGYNTHVMSVKSSPGNLNDAIVAFRWTLLFFAMNTAVYTKSGKEVTAGIKQT
jgi:hypothetical protein